MSLNISTLFIDAKTAIYQSNHFDMVQVLTVTRGWVFLERTLMPSGIQFTTHSIDVLLWKRNDSSIVL